MMLLLVQSITLRIRRFTYIQRTIESKSCLRQSVHQPNGDNSRTGATLEIIIATSTSGSSTLQYCFYNTCVEKRPGKNHSTGIREHMKPYGGNTSTDNGTISAQRVPLFLQMSVHAYVQLPYATRTHQPNQKEALPDNIKMPFRPSCH